MNKYYSKYVPILLLFLITLLSSQNIIDGIAAIVEDRVILKSEVQQYASMQAQRMQIKNRSKYNNLLNNSLNQLINNKLILEQAEIDTIEIEERRVDKMLNQQINRMVSQAGGEEALEERFGKSIREIKQDNRSLIRERLIMQKYRQMNLKDIHISRREIENFYKQYKDSIGKIPPAYTFGQILIKPQAEKSEVQDIKNKADSIYKLIKNGASFNKLAKKYSDDKGTAKYGGDLGYTKRGSLVDNYEKAAFSMEEGEIKGPIKTQFGFHIIKLEDKKGEKVRTRHILFKVGKTRKNWDKARKKTQNIREKLLNNEISFDSAAVKYSDFKNADVNKGIVNKVQKNEIKNQSYLETLDTLKKGEISPVFKNDRGYNILKLIDIHDNKWSTVKKYALNQKKQKKYQKLIKDLKDKFSIKKYGIR